MEELELPTFLTMMRYLADHPPVHIVIAALAGVRPRKQPQKAPPVLSDVFESMISRQVAGEVSNGG